MPASTLVKGTLRGVKITEAHREHYYQPLSAWAGASKCRIDRICVDAAGRCSALACMKLDGPAYCALALCGIYAYLMFVLDRR